MLSTNTNAGIVSGMANNWFAPGSGFGVASDSDGSLVADSDLRLNTDSTVDAVSDTNVDALTRIPGMLYGYVSKKERATSRQLRGHDVVRKQLQSGAMLLSPHAQTRVETPFGTVTLSPKSIAIVIASKNQLAIYDLHDDRSGGITLESDGNRFVLSPGRSLHLNRGQEAAFESINPIPYVRYRQVVTQRLANSMTAFTSEFHILSLVSGLQPLRRMVGSPEAADKNMSNRLLRTVSLLAVMNNSQEPFELRLPKTQLASIR